MVIGGRPQASECQRIGMTKINVETLKILVHSILEIREDEIGCETCFDQLDKFVELNLAGKGPGQALPLVQRHLEMCNGCCEEYEALLEALEAIEAEGH